MADATIVRQAVIMFFGGNEDLSIIETLGITGVPLLGVVKNMLEALKKKGEGPRVE